MNPPPLPQQAITHVAANAYCPACKGTIEYGVSRCRHCGEDFRVSNKSDGLACCLALFLGPVGLWYKGCWGAGFAWLAGIFLWAVVTVALAFIPIIFLPVFPIGMMIHAYKAKPRSN